MSLPELFLLAAGLSMDAFAVAICIGLTMGKFSLRKALTVGLYFGIFQAGMPILGFAAAALFAERIIAFDHWIAFVLLGFLGVRMIVGSFQAEVETRAYGQATSARELDEAEAETNATLRAQELTPKKMLPLAVATSIDAMAVGGTFAFLKVNIISAVAFIGITTLLFSMAGVKIGNAFGAKLKSKAEFSGGIILILIGTKILIEHLITGS